MTLLAYNSKYVIASATPSTTTNSALQDDPQASQVFTLGATQIVLAIYAANGAPGATQPATGIQNAISVDASDKALSYDSAGASGRPVRNCTFWIGSLAAGEHTIKGRFASMTNGSTATISNRVLLIYIFDGDEFQYVDDATSQGTSSASFVDDSYASKTFTPSAACVLLALYNVTNSGATESNTGKVAAISIAGSDYGQAEKSPGASNYADSVFTVHCLSRTAVSTVVKGRFASSYSGTITVARRQLGVLLIEAAVAFDIVTSTTQFTTTSQSLVDDTQASISRTPAAASELLVIAMGTKRKNVNFALQSGQRYGIKVDANDRANSCGAPCNGGASWAQSMATAWGESVTAAAHTVKGRVSNNEIYATACIDARQVVALWLVLHIALPTLTTGAATGLGLD